MNKKIGYIFLTFLVLFYPLYSAIGQNQHTLQLIGKSYGDSVILRWAPSSPIAWQIGNENGYWIERYLVAKNGKLIKEEKPTKIRLNSTPVLPIPLDNWEPIVKNNHYAAIAAQALYGETFKITDPSSATADFIDLSQEATNRHGFALFAADQSAIVAHAMGLRWVDRKIKKGEKYVYRVMLTQQNPELKIDTASLFIDPADIMKLPPPMDVQATFNERSVLLSWDYTYQKNIYTSFFVERSSDGKNFSKMKNLPFLNTDPSGKDIQRVYFTDSVGNSEKTYFYRIVGKTPFDETGPPSESVEVRSGTSLEGTVPFINKTELFKNGAVWINWRFPENLENKIKGFLIERAIKETGPFTTITDTLLANARNHIDHKPLRTNYYKVIAITKQKKKIYSFPALALPEDSIPPIPPINLEGSINEKGIVTLKWSKNKESDLLGYRVFRANDLKEEFIQVTRTTLKTTSFQDTINVKTLTPKVYYKIIAEDNYYNPSEYSDILEIKRPDILPPAAPAFKNVNSTDSAIHLQWAASNSLDVKNYLLHRKTKETTWELLTTLDTAKTSYNDTNVKRGQSYAYKLVAQDESDLISTPTIIYTEAIDNGFRPAINKIKHEINREEHYILIGWQYQEPNVDHFLIYRAEGEQPLRLYKKLDKKNSIFKDESLSANTTYSYRIKAKFKNGASSLFSDELIITY